MDARRREEVQLPTIKYRIQMYAGGEPQIEDVNCMPIITAVGNYLKVDYTNGKIVFIKDIVLIQIDEIKVAR